MATNRPARLSEHEGPLRFIQPLLSEGIFPPGLIPSGLVAELATLYLKDTFLPREEADILRNAARIESRVPFGMFVESIALRVHPYLSDSDLIEKNELGTLCDHLCYDFSATPEGLNKEAFSQSRREIYQRLSHHQLWLLQILPTPDEDSIRQALEIPIAEWLKAAYDILDGCLLRIAVEMEAWAYMQWLAPEDRPEPATNWSLGKTIDPSWFFASEGRLSRSEEVLESLREWAELPMLTPEKFHFKNENPKDREMKYPFAEACRLEGWEKAANPKAWLRTVAKRLALHRQIDDEVDFVKARAAGHDGGFTTVDDLGVVDAERADHLACNTIPEVEDLPTSLLGDAFLAGIKDREAVQRVIDARSRGVPWKEIPEADRSKYRRANRVLKEYLNQHAIFRAAPERTFTSGSESVYQERFPRRDGIDRTWVHVHDSDEKLDALRDVLSRERPHLRPSASKD